MNEFMETSNSDVFAVGDIAAFPWRGEHMRSEHWILAGDMGDKAALNMLGKKSAYLTTPFFWTVLFFKGT